ncbi:SBBP repeat-containing protein [bacterium]|nr:SBBP repeat-containing protein [bacterium]
MKTKLIFFVFLLLAGSLKATTLVFSTFAGGNSQEECESLKTDGSGNTYVTGQTFSNDFPTVAGSYDTSFNGYNDIFVSKLNTSGSGLDYSTFIGGSNADYSYSLSIDGGRNVYVTGRTWSNDFPTVNGSYDTSWNSYSDVFILKLKSGGSVLVYSTFIGGTCDETGNSLTIDGNENCYVTGYTYSNSFPATSGAYDTLFSGGVFYDVFVLKLNSSGSTIIYSTFIGEENDDVGNSLSIDVNGNSYITGYTYSSNFPTTVGAYDTSFNGGNYDAFLTKLNSNGSTLVYSTFLGSYNYDLSSSISINLSGNSCVTGYTYSNSFPTTVGAYDTSFNGGNYDVFVTKLNPNGSTLVYSTFLGGNSYEEGKAITVDENGNSYITGYSHSLGFPTTNSAYDVFYNGNTDTFLTKLNSNGSTLVYSTFLGGMNEDVGESVFLDTDGNCFVAGTTFSTNFPTTNDAYDISFNGGDSDIFTTKFNPIILKVKNQNNLEKTFKLNQNFPNPFNPNTTISYELPNKIGKLLIFNVKGEKIYELVLDKVSGSVVWNGTDFSGKTVSSGIYFYKLETKQQFSDTKKMIFLK